MAGYNPEVLAHINMMQDIIKRMASNSSSCKQWCILVITAIIAFFAKEKAIKLDLNVVCLVPLISFCFLDCFYLSLERQIRSQFNRFIADVNSGKTIDNDLFFVGLRPYADNYTFCDKTEEFAKNKFLLLGKIIYCFFSFSIFPYYGGMYLLLCLIVNN